MRYDAPDWLTRHIFNPLVMLATNLGLSMRGSRTLRHRGRKSGEMYTTPVNVLDLDGARYLVAPRGNTQWSRNVRAAGGGELRVGRKREQFSIAEVPDAEKPPILRAYLKLWKSETGKWFEGRNESSSDDEMLGIAADHPVFRITTI
jgi:deazaflavin-dependent oxidoreductase (nitroreductase family)